MLGQAPSPVDILSYALGFGALVGGIGYAVGQYFSSRRRGVSDSLKTALDEVEVGKVRGDRLSILLAEKTDELSQAKMENHTLRTTLTSGAAVAPAILEALNAALTDAKKFAHDEHERTRKAIQEALNGR